MCTIGQLLVNLQVSQREGITFLGQNSDNKFYTIPGIDYIAHDDVLPYEQSDSMRDPIQHNLFQKFLQKKTDPSTNFSKVIFMRIPYVKIEYNCLQISTSSNTKSSSNLLFIKILFRRRGHFLLLDEHVAPISRGQFRQLTSQRCPQPDY